MESRLIAVLQPVTEDRPCGDDLSFSPEFDYLQEARREDDDSVDYGEWQAALKQADWPAVVESCTRLLRARSKDLRVAAWLCEGLVKTAGLQGLYEGIEILGALITRFGQQLHPHASDGDQEQRVGTLTWFVLRMTALTREIPLAEINDVRFCLNDYESARALQSLVQRNPESVAGLEGRVTLEKIAAAAARTDRQLIGKWMAEGARCKESLARLSDASDVLFGNDAPSFSPLVKGLESIEQQLQITAREIGLLHPAAEREVADEVDIPAHTYVPGKMRQVPGRIASREQAMDALREVALFFRNTEPHSPVAYVVDKALRWGSMPLHEWLRSVVKDDGSLSHLEELLGLEQQRHRD